MGGGGDVHCGLGMEEFVCFIIISKWKGIENL